MASLFERLRKFLPGRDKEATSLSLDTATKPIPQRPSSAAMDNGSADQDNVQNAGDNSAILHARDEKISQEIDEHFVKELREKFKASFGFFSFNFTTAAKAKNLIGWEKILRDLEDKVRTDKNDTAKIWADELRNLIDDYRRKNHAVNRAYSDQFQIFFGEVQPRDLNSQIPALSSTSGSTRTRLSAAGSAELDQLMTTLSQLPTSSSPVIVHPPIAATPQLETDQVPHSVSSDRQNSSTPRPMPKFTVRPSIQQDFDDSFGGFFTRLFSSPASKVQVLMDWHEKANKIKALNSGSDGDPIERLKAGQIEQCIRKYLNKNPKVASEYEAIKKENIVRGEGAKQGVQFPAPLQATTRGQGGEQSALDFYMEAANRFAQNNPQRVVSNQQPLPLPQHQQEHQAYASPTQHQQGVSAIALSRSETSLVDRVSVSPELSRQSLPGATQSQATVLADESSDIDNKMHQTVIELYDQLQKMKGIIEEDRVEQRRLTDTARDEYFTARDTKGVNNANGEFDEWQRQLNKLRALNKEFADNADQIEKLFSDYPWLKEYEQQKLSPVQEHVPVATPVVNDPITNSVEVAHTSQPGQSNDFDEELLMTFYSQPGSDSADFHSSNHSHHAHSSEVTILERISGTGDPTRIEERSLLGKIKSFCQENDDYNQYDQLKKRGVAAYEQKDYKVAVNAFEQAEQHLKACIQALENYDVTLKLSPHSQESASAVDLKKVIVNELTGRLTFLQLFKGSSEYQGAQLTRNAEVEAAQPGKNKGTSFQHSPVDSWENRKPGGSSGPGNN